VSLKLALGGIFSLTVKTTLPVLLPDAHNGKLDFFLNNNA